MKFPLQNKFFFLVRLLFYLSPFLILVYIIYLETNPLGLPRQYKKIPGRKHKIISELGPRERVRGPLHNEEGEVVQQLINELVYFNVRRLAKNQEVRIKAYFKTNLEEANLGVLRSRQQEADFEVRPIYNDFLENLLWNFLIQDGLVLYQREEEFDSIAQFLQDPPLARSRVIYYQNKTIPFLPLNPRELGGVDFILTRYQRTKKEKGGWKSSEQVFEVKKYFLDDNSLRFVFLLPQLEKGYFEIKKIELVVDEPANKYLKRIKQWFIK